MPITESLKKGPLLSVWALICAPIFPVTTKNLTAETRQVKASSWSFLLAFVEVFNFPFGSEPCRCSYL
jgi:hypothetical protein